MSFKIQLMQRHLLAFYKVAKWRDNAPLSLLMWSFMCTQLCLGLNPQNQS